MIFDKNKLKILFFVLSVAFFLSSGEVKGDFWCGDTDCPIVYREITRVIGCNPGVICTDVVDTVNWLCGTVNSPPSCGYAYDFVVCDRTPLPGGGCSSTTETRWYDCCPGGGTVNCGIAQAGSCGTGDCRDGDRCVRFVDSDDNENCHCVCATVHAFITANGSEGPITVNSGESFLLEWEGGAYEGRCTLDGVEVPTDGVISTSLTSSHTYNFRCWNNCSDRSDSVTINVVALNPPTCTLTPNGGRVMCRGDNATFTNDCTDVDSDLYSAGIFWSPQSVRSWTRIVEDDISPSSAGSLSVSGTHLWDTAGIYYVHANSNGGHPGNRCSGNQWCEWPPDGIVPELTCATNIADDGIDRWADCGPDDTLTVTVQGQRRPTPQSAIFTCPGNTPETPIVELDWDDQSCVTEYEVYWCVGALCTPNVLVGTPAASGFIHNLTTARNGQINRYMVRGCNSSSGNSFCGTFSPVMEVDVRCPWCEIDLPNNVSVSVGEDLDPILASVTEYFGTTQQVAFSSTNPSVVSINPPATDITSPTWSASIHGESAGSAIINATATITGSGYTNTCPTNTTTDTDVNVSEAGWWQVGTGDIVANGTIASVVPATATNPYLVLDPDSGVVLHSGVASLDLNGADVSTTNWSTNTDDTSRLLNFDYFYAKLPGTLTSNANFTFSSNTINQNFLTTSGVSRSGYRWLRYSGTGDLTLDNGASGFSFGDNKIILFVDNANVVINSDITFNEGRGLFMVISDGSITVSGSVGGAVDGVPELMGIYVADGTFTSLDSGTQEQLHLKGHVVANSFSLNRDMGAGNNTSPGDFFEFSPGMKFSVPRGLRAKSISWKEVVP